MKRIRSILSLCLVLTVLLAAAALSGCEKQGMIQQTDAAVQTTVAAVQTTAEAAPATTTAAPDGRIELGIAPDGDDFYYNFEFSCAGTLYLQGGRPGDRVSPVPEVFASVVRCSSAVTAGELNVPDADGMYWAFYVDGAYASTGVDTTPITEGATYALTATKD